MEHHKHYEDSASELLDGIKGLKGIGPYERPFGWPVDGKGLSTVLDRIAPLLRKVGVEVIKPQRTSAKRKIVLKWTGAPATVNLTSDVGSIVG